MIMKLCELTKRSPITPGVTSMITIGLKTRTVAMKYTFDHTDSFTVHVIAGISKKREHQYRTLIPASKKKSLYDN